MPFFCPKNSYFGVAAPPAESLLALGKDMAEIAESWEV
jgi:hypothetical protein